MDRKILYNFNKILRTGWIQTAFPNNRDGGAGNTLETLLGVRENNKKLPDYNGIELKTQRSMTSSVVSLFSKSPTGPEKANTILKERYGESRNGSVGKKLYASIRGSKGAQVYDKYDFSMRVDRRSKKIWLQIVDQMGNTDKEVYWTFQDIKIAASKLNELALFIYDEKKIDGILCFNYFQIYCYSGFNIDEFLNLIQKGKIQFDLRIGEHHTGANTGRTHDHGSGFRINKDDLKLLYERFRQL